MITYEMFKQRIMCRLISASESGAYLMASYVLYGKGIRTHVTQFLQEYPEYATTIDWNIPEWLKDK